MSQKGLPYPAGPGYGPSGDQSAASAPPAYDGNYPGPPPAPMPQPGPPLPPGAQPLPGMQPGFQLGYQPGYQPGYQLGYQPGYVASYPQPQAGYPQPVIQQPVPQGWMTIPQGLTNCPPGLEYLSLIDQLLVHQKVELLEAFVGFETNNKYTVKNSIGQKVYYAVEDNDCCTRNCCGPMRPFNLRIMDNFQNEVIHLNRPLACDSCCCPCWLQKMEVFSPPGTLVGSIEQQWSILKPSFAIKNSVDDVVLMIEGPFCTFSICGDVEFKVMSKDGSRQVGRITKQWSGLAREVFTDSDYFGISFPMDLDVKIKAVLLGACFLIDFMFFEKSGNRERDTPGMF